MKYKYLVFQFYPNGGVPVRVLGYNRYDEAIECVNICRNYADVPYMLMKGKQIIDICTFDLTREQMAQMIEENC